jgi:hypothetical protein
LDWLWGAVGVDHCLAGAELLDDGVGAVGFTDEKFSKF